MSDELLENFMVAWKDFLMVEQGTNGVMNVQMVALHFYKLGFTNAMEVKLGIK